MMVLARFVSPEEFGVYALSTALAAFAATLVEFGLPAYLIRAPESRREDIAAAVGVALAAALAFVALMALGWALLPPDLWPEGMQPVLALLLVALLVRPLVLPVTTALQRAVDFRLLSVVSVVTAAVEVVVASAMAVMGFGAVALAAAVLVERLVWAALLLVYAGKDRLIAPSFRGWAPLLSFGARFAATDLVASLGNLVGTAAIGRLLGFGALGAFNRARTVVDLMDKTVLEGMAPVVLPALAKSLRDGRDPAGLYLMVTGHLTALCWPAFALIALMAEPLVAVLLGPRWGDTSGIVQILALIGVFAPFTKMSKKWFVALDRTGEYLRRQTIFEVLRAAMTFCGALVSLEAACLGFALGWGVKVALLAPALQRAVGCPAGAVLAVCYRGLGLTAFALAGPVVLLATDPALGDLGLLLAALPLAGCGWLAGLAATGHPLMGEFTGLVRRLLRGAQDAALRR